MAYLQSVGGIYKRGICFYKHVDDILTNRCVPYLQTGGWHIDKQVAVLTNFWMTYLQMCGGYIANGAVASVLCAAVISSSAAGGQFAVLGSCCPKFSKTKWTLKGSFSHLSTFPPWCEDPGRLDTSDTCSSFTSDTERIGHGNREILRETSDQQIM